MKSSGSIRDGKRTPRSGNVAAAPSRSIWGFMALAGRAVSIAMPPVAERKPPHPTRYPISLSYPAATLSLRERYPVLTVRRGTACFICGFSYFAAGSIKKLLKINAEKRLNHASPLPAFKNVYVAGEGSGNRMFTSTQLTGGVRRRRIVI